MERDLQEKKWLGSLQISTHTLTWSVTVLHSEKYNLLGHFNSHAHVERDNFSYITPVVAINFNSHAHVERDPRNSETGLKTFYFNSHAHVERDMLQQKAQYIVVISTHTLTWSVTLDVVYIWCLLNVMRTYFFI